MKPKDTILYAPVNSLQAMHLIGLASRKNINYVLAADGYRYLRAHPVRLRSSKNPRTIFKKIEKYARHLQDYNMSTAYTYKLAIYYNKAKNVYGLYLISDSYWFNRRKYLNKTTYKNIKELFEGSTKNERKE